MKLNTPKVRKLPKGSKFSESAVGAAHKYKSAMSARAGRAWSTVGSHALPQLADQSSKRVTTLRVAAAKKTSHPAAGMQAPRPASKLHAGKTVHPLRGHELDSPTTGARPAIKDAGKRVPKQKNDPTKQHTLQHGKKGGTFYLSKGGKKVYAKK